MICPLRTFACAFDPGSRARCAPPLSPRYPSRLSSVSGSWKMRSTPQGQQHRVPQPELCDPSESSVRTGQTELKEAVSGISWMGLLSGWPRLERWFPVRIFKLIKSCNHQNTKYKLVLLPCGNIWLWNRVTDINIYKGWADLTNSSLQYVFIFIF